MYNYYRYGEQPKVVSYTVQTGDSLWKIAQLYNSSTNEIMAYNNLNSTVIYPGQVLTIPVGVNEDYVLVDYVTQPEDSLALIAQKYNITPEQIAEYNDINALFLKPQQTVNIPLPSVYTIQAGDTIGLILQKYHLTIEQFLNLNPQLLRPGQTVNIR